MILNDLFSAEELNAAMHDNSRPDGCAIETFKRITETYAEVFTNCINKCGGILPPEFALYEVRIMLGALVCVDSALKKIKKV